MSGKLIYKLSVRVTYDGSCYVISLYVFLSTVCTSLYSMCFPPCTHSGTSKQPINASKQPINTSHLHPSGHRVEGIQKLEQIQMVRRVVQ